MKYNKLCLIGVGNELAEQDKAGLWLYERLTPLFPGSVTAHWVSPKVEEAEDLALFAQRGVVVMVDSLGPDHHQENLLLTRYRPDLLEEDPALSSHGFGIASLFGLTEALMGQTPRVYLVGVPSVVSPKTMWVKEAEVYIRQLIGPKV